MHVNIINTEREVFNAQLERMYNEEFGDTNETLEGMSVKKRKAEEIKDQSATLVNGHYQIRLPFREDVPNLPDRLWTAARRLKWLERRCRETQSSIASTAVLLKNTELKDAQDKHPTKR